MADPIIVRLRENGPIVVPAAMLKIQDHLGNDIPIPAGKEMIALCRCGQSKNKPFCDGAHKACGFIGTSSIVNPAP
jgi:CDGSH-type Zn-finger protein